MPKRFSLVLLSLFFIGVGVMHFVKPQPFVEIVPRVLPQPLMLVWISGFFEIAGGVGVLIKKTRRWAGYGLIWLLVAVFPANIHMAVNNINLGLNVPQAVLWLRLPLQFLLMFWVWKAAVRSGDCP